MKTNDVLAGPKWVEHSVRAHDASGLGRWVDRAVCAVCFILLDCGSNMLKRTSIRARVRSMQCRRIYVRVAFISPDGFSTRLYL